MCPFLCPSFLRFFFPEHSFSWMLISGSQETQRSPYGCIRRYINDIHDDGRLHIHDSHRAVHQNMPLATRESFRQFAESSLHTHGSHPQSPISLELSGGGKYRANRRSVYVSSVRMPALFYSRSDRARLFPCALYAHHLRDLLEQKRVPNVALFEAFYVCFRQACVVEDTWFISWGLCRDDERVRASG